MTTDSTSFNGPDALNAWAALHQASLLAHKTIGQVLAPLDLSLAQASVLLALDRANGPLPLSRLARALVQEAQSMTSLIDRLEARGLVRRVPNRRDRRIIHVALTPEGQQLLCRALPALRQGSARAFAALTSDELRTLACLANRLRDHNAALLGIDTTMAAPETVYPLVYHA